MVNLDDILIIKKLDKSNTLGSIRMLPEQCEQAWRESTKLGFSRSLEKIDNIVIAGMGGSTYGVRIVKSLYDGSEMTRMPIELVNNYWLPGYVNEKTLVILSSYSGATEEILAVAKQAKEKRAKIIGITSGGELAKFLISNKYPSYIFDPLYNPCRQPRIGVGYMVMGLIGILSKLKIIPVGDQEVKKLFSYLKNQAEKYDDSVSTSVNPAKKLARRLTGKIPVLVVADFLEGAAHAVRNPFHETAKQFGLYFSIPELNHHLMEGLSFPSEIKKLLFFVFVNSLFYDERNIKRLELTKEVIEKNGLNAENIVLSGYSALVQAMELVQLGAWTTFYMAMLNNVDPAEIPWVDYFKNKLKRFPLG